MTSHDDPSPHHPDADDDALGEGLIPLGLDVGTRRIGVAVSDPTGMYAMPLETIETRPPEAALARVAALITARGAGVLVVGWPVELDGSEGRACQRTERWIARTLEQLSACGLPTPQVVRWDERLTSASAEATLIGLDVSRARRKEVVDQVAATHILEGYLRRLAHARERRGQG